MVDLPIDGDFFESLHNGDSIVYSKTENYENALLIEGHHRSLITHNSDKNVTKEMFDKFISSGKYDYWYAQNVNYKHERLIPIPIGFERKRWCNFNKYNTLIDCKENFKSKPEKTLYANFSVGTNRGKRYNCINSFIGKEYLTNDVKMFTPNVSQLTEQQYRDYCNNILEHKFVLCPEGNGIDTHRLWEVLYLGRIPVVLHNPTNDSFSDLPILILDNWDQFDEKKNDIIIGKNEMLFCNYWKERLCK